MLLYLVEISLMTMLITEDKCARTESMLILKLRNAASSKRKKQDLSEHANSNATMDDKSTKNYIKAHIIRRQNIYNYRIKKVHRKIKKNHAECNIRKTVHEDVCNSH